MQRAERIRWFSFSIPTCQVKMLLTIFQTRHNIVSLYSSTGGHHGCEEENRKESQEDNEEEKDLIIRHRLVAI